MKNIKTYISNIYKLSFLSRNKRNDFLIHENNHEENIQSRIIDAVKNDKLDFEANPAIKVFLQQKIRQKRELKTIHSNSFADLFLSLFKPRYLELKLATLGLAIVLGTAITKNSDYSAAGNLDSLCNKIIVCDTFPKNAPSVADTTIR